jgi:ribulose-5-phosphate 4-epimerase/fuculose-1-phosphate aldolase
MGVVKMASELADVKYDVAVANRVLSAIGLATGPLVSLGHASWRLPSDPNKFVVKGRGYELDALPLMRPEDMIVCDLDGYKIDGPPGSTQCYEVQLHACIYKTHPDVQSVVHCHPRYTVVMSVLQATLLPMCNEGIQLVRKPLPVWPHNKIITSLEEGMEVAEAMGDSKAVLLQGHGAATTGNNLGESVINMLNLEEQAKMNWYAYCAAGPAHASIPEELIAESANRPQLPELPHFKDLMATQGDPRTRGAVNAVFAYYAQLVSQDLKRA